MGFQSAPQKGLVMKFSVGFVKNLHFQAFGIQGAARSAAFEVVNAQAGAGASKECALIAQKLDRIAREVHDLVDACTAGIVCDKPVDVEVDRAALATAPAPASAPAKAKAKPPRADKPLALTRNDSKLLEWLKSHGDQNLGKITDAEMAAGADMKLGSIGVSKKKLVAMGYIVKMKSGYRLTDGSKEV